MTTVPDIIEIILVLKLTDVILYDWMTIFKVFVINIELEQMNFRAEHGI